MDARTAAHALTRIAAHLELAGTNRFKVRAYERAARSLLAFAADDLAEADKRGDLERIPGLGTSTLSVVRELIVEGESRYLERLRAQMPEGLTEMLDIPGLSPARIRQFYEQLGIQTIDDLEAAARDGRLQRLPKIGPKTAERIAAGIASARDRRAYRLYHQMMIEARHVLTSIQSHPDVIRAELAGDLRRRLEVADRLTVVAEVRSNPAAVAEQLARTSSVKRVRGAGASLTITFVDDLCLELHCASPEHFVLAWWCATGNADHVKHVGERLAERGIRLEGNALWSGDRAVPLRSEEDLYRAAGLAYVEPELREGRGEVDAAAAGRLPRLITLSDIRGVMHCHTTASDGTASTSEMAQAARDRGWSYIGITDHSQSAFYAGGLSADSLLRQHDEIDRLNAIFGPDFSILKGIESDILPDGALDYPDDILARCDFVVGSVHSRLSMDRDQMTARLLRALDHPRLTILAHPTGRLLLSRAPSDFDVDAVIDKAVLMGVAIELNSDPRRLDLDWRLLRKVKDAGGTVVIGPDAHSTRGLDVMDIGIGLARKAWLEAADVLNTRAAATILGS